MLFLRVPSVSTDADYSAKLARSAHWLVGDNLNAASAMESQALVPTPVNPVVWGAQKKNIQAGPRNVNHLKALSERGRGSRIRLELWILPPFDPVLN